MSEGEPKPQQHPRDPLHGVTLETILRTLQERHGWEEMGRKIRVRCFNENPSIKSSLTFLRKTPWARERVEAWYIYEKRRFPDAPGPKESA
ncbi:VF530 family protein [Haloferula sp. BvORR071]|uniref:VF530 family protein n=1 Tax=Haloferula sp. BvORR071 TaxID=1396141 RepID=UPI000558FF49|nr:VF530 family protein [Haloferula sp. BvORR071]